MRQPSTSRTGSFPSFTDHNRWTQGRSPLPTIIRFLLYCCLVSAIAAPAQTFPTRAHPSHEHPAYSGSNLFAPVVPYEILGQDSSESELAVADLRQNGTMDILVVGSNSQDQPVLNVFLGNGDGTFQSSVAYSASGSNYIAIGDLNGDGYPDVVVGSPFSLSVLLGNGDGTLQPAISYALLAGECYSPPGPIIIADVNGDGVPDLVALSQSTQGCGNGVVNVLIGNGNGTFAPATGYGTGGIASSWMAVADLNGDGILDIVVSSCGTSSSCLQQQAVGNIGVLMGQGNGTFAPVVPYETTAPTAFSGMFVIADMNGDGIPDIVLATSCWENAHGDFLTDAYVDVFIGTGDGTFQSPVGYDAASIYTNQLAIADLNGDGSLDVAVANSGGASVFLGNGNGTLQPAHAYFVASGDSQIQVLDVNNDGILDLVVPGDGAIDGPGPEAGVLLGKGDGTFFGPLLFVTGDLGEPFFPWATMADVNGDGLPDLITTSYVNYYNFDAVGVLLNNSNFVFNNTATSLSTSRNPAAPNQTVTYSAVITPLASGTPTGEVWFVDHGADLVGIAGLENNQASVSVKYKTPGPHQITADYTGDNNFAGSYSASIAQDIQGRSTTKITTSGSPSFVGQAVTFTATITSPYGSIPNGETVTFSLSGTVLGTGTTASGVATLTTPLSKSGTHLVKAAYPGDDTFAPSSGTVQQVVNLYPSTTSLASAPNPSTLGQAVTLTATVNSAAPGGPTGKVVFKNGATTLGASTLKSRVATLTTSKLPVGTLALTADYDGDKQSAKSSGTTTQVVTQ